MTSTEAACSSNRLVSQLTRLKGTPTALETMAEPCLSTTST